MSISYSNLYSADGFCTQDTGADSEQQAAAFPLQGQHDSGPVKSPSGTFENLCMLYCLCSADLLRLSWLPAELDAGEHLLYVQCITAEVIVCCATSLIL